MLAFGPDTAIIYRDRVRNPFQMYSLLCDAWCECSIEQGPQKGRNSAQQYVFWLTRPRFLQMPDCLSEAALVLGLEI